MCNLPIKVCDSLQPVELMILPILINSTFRNELYINMHTIICSFGHQTEIVQTYMFIKLLDIFFLKFQSIITILQQVHIDQHAHWYILSFSQLMRL